MDARCRLNGIAKPDHPSKFLHGQIVNGPNRLSAGLLVRMQPLEQPRNSVDARISNGHRRRLLVHMLSVCAKCRRQRPPNRLIVFDEDPEQIHHDKTRRTERMALRFDIVRHATKNVVAPI